MDEQLNQQTVEQDTVEEQLSEWTNQEIWDEFEKLTADKTKLPTWNSVGDWI